MFGICKRCRHRQQEALPMLPELCDNCREIEPLEMELAQALDVIRDIRRHHVAVNERQGRPLSHSRTIAMCDRVMNV